MLIKMNYGDQNHASTKRHLIINMVGVGSLADEKREAAKIIASGGAYGEPTYLEITDDQYDRVRHMENLLFTVVK